LVEWKSPVTTDRKEPVNQSEWNLCIISINLLAYYHGWGSLIGYATYYLFCDR